MSELISRFKAKLKEIFYETPLPNFIKKYEPKETADKKEPPEDDELDPLFKEELPDDFRDIKLEKSNRLYHIKLKDIPPHQWMLVGTKLRNMAFEDPEYGHDYDDTQEDPPEPPDPLPPPPEPTEYIKSLNKPLISLNLKNLSWVDLEEVGELFYDLGWTHQKKYDVDDYEGLADEFNRCDDFPTTEEEDFEDALFDPVKRIAEEMTEVKRITNSDVLPNHPKVPWKDDQEAWLESPHPDNPPWDDTPEDDYATVGKIFPLQNIEKFYIP